MEDTVGTFTTVWVDSLFRKKQKAAREDLVNPVNTNFTVLAEHLLSPHRLHMGLEKPDHRAHGMI